MSFTLRERHWRGSGACTGDVQELALTFREKPVEAPAPQYQRVAQGAASPPARSVELQPNQ
jgi:hypothetical protein